MILGEHPQHTSLTIRVDKLDLEQKKVVEGALEHSEVLEVLLI
jgi:hypothetical protein